MVAKPEEYQWSSYRSYMGQSKAPDWLKTDFILGYFSKKTLAAKTKYRVFTEDLLQREYDSPLKATVASTILGSPEFVNEVSAWKLGEKQEERNVPAVKALALRPSMNEIITKIKTEFGGEKPLRNISIYCCRKYSGENLKTIGERFGISDAAISQARRRLALKAERDQQLQQMIEKVEALLGRVRS